MTQVHRVDEGACISLFPYFLISPFVPIVLVGSNAQGWALYPIPYTVYLSEVRRTWLKTKKPCLLNKAFLVIKDRQRLTLPGVILVPSALVGLTALFGMGRGDPHRYSHLKIMK